MLRLRFLLGDGFVFRAVAAERGKRAAATTRVGGRRSKQDGVAAASRENNQETGESASAVGRARVCGYAGGGQDVRRSQRWAGQGRVAAQAVARAGACGGGAGDVHSGGGPVAGRA